MRRALIHRVLLTFPQWKFHGLSVGRSECVLLQLHFSVLFRRFHYRLYATILTEICSFTGYKWFSWQHSGYGDIRLGLYCVWPESGSGGEFHSFS